PPAFRKAAGEPWFLPSVLPTCFGAALPGAVFVGPASRAGPLPPFAVAGAFLGPLRASPPLPKRPPTCLGLVLPVLEPRRDWPPPLPKSPPTVEPPLPAPILPS